MAEMSDAERQELVIAIASREGTARELAERFGYTTKELRAFVDENKKAILYARISLEDQEEEATEEDLAALERGDVVTPAQLDELWISKKIARLTRYETIANKLYADAMTSSPDSTVLRELRAYMNAAAQELGQLLHRGAGDSGTGDKLTVHMVGVDPDSFR